MSRRIYGLLQIAQRHPRMFAAMHATATDLSDVRDGGDGFQLPNSAMSFAQDCADAVAKLRTLRGEPYTWACVPWRTDTPARRRDEPRASRWGDLT
jgi:hypothetical protein